MDFQFVLARFLMQLSICIPYYINGQEVKQNIS